MTAVGTRGTRSARRLPAYDVIVLALLAYVPFLLSSPGRLSSDTKQYLYLDPGRFLARVPWLWDPHVAAGTVPHQQLGYLFPMGPFFWLLDLVGCPDWIAQRLWLGTISLAAALGARWLFRRLGLGPAAAFVAAVVYVLSPYQLAFTARISVLLLPWAALPWIVGLTMRAVRRGGWRDPAAIALIVLTIGGVNASALVLVAIGPALWIVLELGHGAERARAALAATARIGVLSLGVSAWWIAGLYLQGSRGLPILQLTENVQTVAASSTPGDILRGLGNWFFYGYDRSGPSLVQSPDYVTNNVVLFFSFLVPALAFLAAGLVRWRYRVYCALCIVVGTVVGVGAWPFDDTTAWGAVWKRFTSDTSVGLALRNSPRVVPVVVLGVAGLVGAGVGACRVTVVRRVLTLAVLVVVAFAFLPVWRYGFLTPGVERPNDIPSYWTDAIHALDAQSHATRVLEIPGSAFATYRWGNTVEPITPGLSTRPYIAREVLPAGSPESVNLLDALDRRIQNGSFEPVALAPLSRIFGIGTIALRSDLAYERSGAPHPRVVWAALTDPRPPGIGAPTTFGPRTPNVAPGVDGIDLRTAAAADPPPVALFPVERAEPIVRTNPDRDPVVLSGDGDGIVDTAAAGLVTGRERILELASLSDTELRHALATGASLVLTDSNRRRDTSFFASIRDTKSPTLRSGQTGHSPDGYGGLDQLFADRSDATRTVLETRGGRVTTSDDGGVDRPEDRGTKAFDGDVRTAWRVGGPDPLHSWIQIRPDRSVRTDHVNVVQPLGLPRDRWITNATVSVNGGPPRAVELGDASFTEAGQTVGFPETSVRSLRIEITGLHLPPFDQRFANAVGFAEVRLGAVPVRVGETVRLPTDLARRVGRAGADHALAVVLTRLRQETGADGREDEEPALDRRFVLPEARTFTLSGTARIDPNGPEPEVDALLGTAPADQRYEASSHLAGDLAARASRAFTTDPRDAWTSAYGPQNQQWLQVTRTTPVTADHVDLNLHVDAHHSVPTTITVLADGTPVATAPVTVTPEVASGATSTTVPMTIAFPATTAQTFRLSIDDAHAPPGPPPAPVAFPPVSIGNVAINGFEPAPTVAPLPSTCSGTVRIDGAPHSFRLVGDPADARSGLGIEACDGTVPLARGSHRLSSRPGLVTGLDVDRVVLTSGADGAASAPGPLVRVTRSAPARAEQSSPSELTVHTRGRDGRPFWLVLGQSHSDGWKATSAGHDLGAPRLVDGYANAWLVDPDGAGPVTVHLSWTPQRTVWIAFGISLVAIVVSVVLLLLGLRRRRALDGASRGDDPADPWYWSWHRPGVALGGVTTAFVAVATFAVTAFVSRWPVAVVAAGAAVVGALVPRVRPAIAVVAAVLLVVARTGKHPGLGWYALALIAVAVVVSALGRGDDRAPADEEPAPAPGDASVPPPGEPATAP